MGAPSPTEYWGYLITPQHPPQPTQIFRRLLYAMADYICHNLEPKHTVALTPEKMASFYRAVGGNIDDLFLHVSPQRLSEIYTALGCAHSLQPSPEDDFRPPCIPALTPRGFVIWQTVQLLMGPGEHTPYIRNAARNWALKDPDSGEWFLREIPEGCFPKWPDSETVDWHNEVLEAVEREKRRKEEEEELMSTAEKAGRGERAAPPSSGLGTGMGTVGGESEEESGYGYEYSARPREGRGGGQRYHYHHYAPDNRDREREHNLHAEGYDYAARYSRSAPGSGREDQSRDQSRSSKHKYRKKGHQHNHSFSHPAAPYNTKIDTPLTSDLDESEEYYTPPQFSRGHHSAGHSRHHSTGGGGSGPLPGDFASTYVYRSGAEVPVFSSKPVSPTRSPFHNTRPMSPTSSPFHNARPMSPKSSPFHNARPLSPTSSPFHSTRAATGGSPLHAFKSYPNLQTHSKHHYHTPPAYEEDFSYARFARHRSSSPSFRAPLHGSHGRRTYYDEDSYDEETATADYEESEEDGLWRELERKNRHRHRHRGRERSRNSNAGGRGRSGAERLFVDPERVVLPKAAGRHGSSRKAAVGGEVPVIYL